MKRNPASTRESVERELLEKGGGSLYLPSQRSVQAPLTCVAWGLSHRLTVSPAHPAPGPNPSLEKMPFRLTEAERNDVEAQDAVGDYLLHRVDRALEAGDPSTALTLLRETENRCSRAPDTSWWRPRWLIQGRVTGPAWSPFCSGPLNYAPTITSPTSTWACTTLQEASTPSRSNI